MFDPDRHVQGPEFDPVHDALNRMRRAHQRGTGCHLTREMISALYITLIGQMWAEDDPRKDKGTET